MYVVYYQVVRGTRRAHTSVSTHATKLTATAEARHWNESYQTDEYWVLKQCLRASI